MARRKKRKIYEIKGKTFEECKRYHNWIHRGGGLEKNISVFVPLSDDYEDPAMHNARRIMEEGAIEEE